MDKEGVSIDRNDLLQDWSIPCVQDTFIVYYGQNVLLGLLSEYSDLLTTLAFGSRHSLGLH